MTISYLNRLSFKEFGDIMSSSFVADENWEDQFIYQSGSEFVCCDNPVYLERLNDMCVIALSMGGDGPVRCFYLDKPVVINPGVWFCVLMLSPRGSIRRVTKQNSACQRSQLPESLHGALFSPELTVGNIYTLFYQEQKKGFFFSGEQHGSYELVYVDTGTLHSVTDGQDYLLKQSEMVLYMPNQWHMQYTEPEHQASFITVSFDMQCKYAPLLGNRKFSASRDIKRLFARLLAEQQSDAFLRDDMMQSILHEILISMLRQERMGERLAPPIDSASTEARESKVIAAAQRYIEDNLDKRLSVEMVAKGVYLSASYLSALFRKHMGMPPSKYILRGKIAKSKRMMQDGSHTLTEIAQLLGFATLQHFSRSFKLETGVTPSEYARALK